MLNDENYQSGTNGQNKVWQHFQNISPETFGGAKPRLDYIIREILKKKTNSFPCVLNIGAGSGYLEETAEKLGWDICPPIFFLTLVINLHWILANTECMNLPRHEKQGCICALIYQFYMNYWTIFVLSTSGIFAFIMRQLAIITSVRI